CPGRDIAGSGRQIDPHRAQCRLDSKLPRLILVHRPIVAIKSTAPDDDAHAEACRAANDLPTNAADAEQPDGPPVESLRVRELLFVPVSGPQFSDVVGQTTI